MKESDFMTEETRETEVASEETAISEKAREGMLYNLLNGPSIIKKGKYYFVP